jgi:hypothetical protein
MIQVAADGQIFDEPTEWAQGCHRIFPAVGPVGVGHDPDFEAHRPGFPDGVQQEGVIQEWLTALEIDRFDSPGFFGLAQDLPHLRQGHRSLLKWAPTHKTVVTLEGALVSQQQVQTG